MKSSLPKEIQLVAFASPYPPNYGGVIDVYYKIKAFADAGIRVHLHAYIYDEHQPSKELNKICASVNYYKRTQSYKYLQGWPYICASRYNKNLIENIQNLGHEVVLEGLHMSFLIPYLKNSNIPYSIRMHNIEWKYYRFLADLEPSYVKKKYFLEEAKRLKAYEDIIADSKILAIAPRDVEYLEKTYPQAQVVEIPPFHHYAKVDIEMGLGEYAIFHANLSVNENEEAALWLIEKVFRHLDYPLLIAGKSPSKKLELAAGAYPHITLVANPSTSQMKELMVQAHIHLLPNKQPTGMKIKWINALFTARFIIVNPDISAQSQDDAGVFVIEDETHVRNQILQLQNQEFEPEQLTQRRRWLGEKYSNGKNALLFFE